MNSREVMQQALEALEQIRTPLRINTSLDAYDVSRAITALRTALAEPEPKEREAGCTLCGYCAATGERIRPPQKPLTDEKIWRLAIHCTLGGDLHANKFARAIEQAHGIKQEETK